MTRNPNLHTMRRSDQVQVVRKLVQELDRDISRIDLQIEQLERRHEKLVAERNEQQAALARLEWRTDHGG